MFLHLVREAQVKKLGLPNLPPVLGQRLRQESLRAHRCFPSRWPRSQLDLIAVPTSPNPLVLLEGLMTFRGGTLNPCLLRQLQVPNLLPKTCGPPPRAQRLDGMMETIAPHGRKNAVVPRPLAPEPGTQVPTAVPAILPEQTARAIVETGLRSENASKSLTASRTDQAVETRIAKMTGTVEVIATGKGIGRKIGTEKGTEKRIRIEKESVKRAEGTESDTDAKESLLVEKSGIVMAALCHLRHEEDAGKRTEPRMNRPVTKYPALALRLKKLPISVAAKTRYVKLISRTFLALY